MQEKYIGGNFASSDIESYLVGGTETQINVFFPEELNSLKRCFFETGADAVSSILNEIDEKTVHVWFPENYCAETILRIRLKTGINVSKYLSINDITVGDNMSSIVVLNHFNGYCKVIAAEVIALKKKPSIIVIEDYVHAPLEIIKFTGDYAFNSLRKIVSLEVAIAYKKKAIIDKTKPSEYYPLKKKAEKLKTAFLLSYDPEIEDQYLHQFTKAEKKLLNDKVWTANEEEISKAFTIDFETIKEKRKSNFQYLKQQLFGLKNIEVLYGDYLFLMVRCESKRDGLKKHLHSNKIFAPIHWADSLSEESLHILSLPIDQRYDFSDMDHIAFNVINFYT